MTKAGEGGSDNQNSYNSSMWRTAHLLCEHQSCHVGSLWGL